MLTNVDPRVWHSIATNQLNALNIVSLVNYFLSKKITKQIQITDPTWPFTILQYEDEFIAKSSYDLIINNNNCNIEESLKEFCNTHKVVPYFISLKEDKDLGKLDLSF